MAASLFSELMLALSNIIDLTDVGFLGHGERVAAVAWLLGKELVPEKKMELLYAGLVHDLGAINAPYHITQYRTLQAQLAEPAILAHPVVGAQLLRTLPHLHTSLHSISDLVLLHHERWDGSGYPRCLSGNEIPLPAQILHLADTLELGLRWSESSNPALDSILAKEDIGCSFSQELYLHAKDILGGESSIQEISNRSKARALLDQALDSERTPLSLTEEQMGAIVTLMARVVDARHHHTAEHSWRVAHYSVEIGQEMQLTPKDMRDLRYAALLHDVGMVAVPQSVLDAQRVLTTEEMGLVKYHPVRTMLIINQISALRNISLIAGYHHVRADGKGYPEGIDTGSIPLGARTIALADAFDAMTSPRPYRKTLTAGEAAKELENGAGTMFDPQVVAAARRVFT